MEGGSPQTVTPLHVKQIHTDHSRTVTTSWHRLAWWVILQMDMSWTSISSEISTPARLHPQPLCNMLVHWNFMPGLKFIISLAWKVMTQSKVHSATTALAETSNTRHKIVTHCMDISSYDWKCHFLLWNTPSQLHRNASFNSLAHSHNSESATKPLHSFETSQNRKLIAAAPSASAHNPWLFLPYRFRFQK